MVSSKCPIMLRKYSIQVARHHKNWQKASLHNNYMQFNVTRFSHLICKLIYTSRFCRKAMLTINRQADQRLRVSILVSPTNVLILPISAVRVYVFYVFLCPFVLSRLLRFDSVEHFFDRFYLVRLREPRRNRLVMQRL